MELLFHALFMNSRRKQGQLYRNIYSYFSYYYFYTEYLQLFHSAEIHANPEPWPTVSPRSFQGPLTGKIFYIYNYTWNQTFPVGYVVLQLFCGCNLFIACVLLFIMINVLYFYIGTFRSGPGVA